MIIVYLGRVLVSNGSVYWASAKAVSLIRCAAGGGPDPEHGLGQAPPAQRRQPLVVVDRLEHLPQRGHRQEQARHGEVIELLVVGEVETVGFVLVVRVLGGPAA